MVKFNILLFFLILSSSFFKESDYVVKSLYDKNGIEYILLNDSIVHFKWGQGLRGGYCFGTYKEKKKQYCFDFSTETEFERSSMVKLNTNFSDSVIISIQDHFGNVLPSMYCEVSPPTGNKIILLSNINGELKVKKGSVVNIDEYLNVPCFKGFVISKESTLLRSNLLIKLGFVETLPSKKEKWNVKKHRVKVAN